MQYVSKRECQCQCLRLRLQQLAAAQARRCGSCPAGPGLTSGASQASGDGHICEVAVGGGEDCAGFKL